MNPFEAADQAAELAEHMTTLAELDFHPVSNAGKIADRRKLALECIEALSAYLIGSDTFTPVGVDQ